MIQTIDDIIKKELEKNNNFKKNAERYYFGLQSEKFKDLYFSYINKLIAKRGVLREFEITKNNEYVMRQLYYHLVGDKDRFDFDMQKGIMLVGKNGVGKTLLLESYCYVRSVLRGSSLRAYHSRKINQLIKEHGFDYFSKAEILIDDLGKENKEINDFGTKIQPIVDLMAFRYDNGALTFATCNYKMSTLQEFYGITTTDRFKEMFNIIELKGESFRK